MSLRTTPFHARTGPLSEGQAWRRWAGYVVASSYELSHDREYHAIRNAAALFDVSPLYKYLVTGRDAARLLDHVVTRNVAKAKVGQVLYTPWCDAEGKQIDDGTISVLGEQTFRMTSADPTLRWLHLNASGLQVSIEDVSESTAALSLQGPNSRAITPACRMTSRVVITPAIATATSLTVKVVARSRLVTCVTCEAVERLLCRGSRDYPRRRAARRSCTSRRPTGRPPSSTTGS